MTEIQQRIEAVNSELSAFDQIPEDQLTEEQKAQKEQYERQLTELKENEAGMQQKISIEQQTYDESKAELDAAQKQLDDTAATLAQTKSELDADEGFFKWCSTAACKWKSPDPVRMD